MLLLQDQVHTLQGNIGQLTEALHAERSHEPTPAPSALSLQAGKRSVRHPDCKDPGFEGWTQDIQDKLYINVDHFPSGLEQAKYVIGRTGGEAKDAIAAHRLGNSDSFQTAHAHNIPTLSLYSCLRTTLSNLFLHEYHLFTPIAAGGLALGLLLRGVGDSRGGGSRSSRRYYNTTMIVVRTFGRFKLDNWLIFSHISVSNQITDKIKVIMQKALQQHTQSRRVFCRSPGRRNSFR
jgi:hypothetical protein